MRKLTSLAYQFRIWLSKGCLLALFVALILLLWLVMESLIKPPPAMIHTLGLSTQRVNVLWIRQDISTWITSNDRMVFSRPVMSDSLIAIDAQTGATVWKLPLSFEHSDIRSLLANQNTVFIVTTLTVDAYDAKTGQPEWSTGLGQGHVSIMSQLDSNVLRIYYGDQIFELDSGTGKILSVMPTGATVWISGNTVLRGFGAFDRRTGKNLWNEGIPLFYYGEGVEPRDLGPDILLVASAPGSRFSQGICALNMLIGQYNWCHTEGFNSMIAVDHHSGLGYAMREDFVLLTIDLQTGKVLGETSFLSSNSTSQERGSVSSVVVSDAVVVVSFGDNGQTFGLKFLP